MSIFERYPKATTALVLFTVALLIVVLLELILRLVFGLGDPLLYRSSPLFGYRLQPNQHVHRRGAEIRVNNLALRADRDWDSNIENKILFLGNSVTFGGTAISNHHLFSHLAVATLDGYLGGNAGTNGWGIENIAALVMDDQFLPARTYVSVVQEMDFYRGLSKLSGKPFWTTKPTLALQELLGVFFLDRLNGMYEDHDRWVSARENEKAVERSCVRLREMDDFLKMRGYDHLIYFSTNTAQLTSGAANDSIVSRYLQRYDIKPMYIKDRIELKSLSMLEQQELFYDWNHLNERGHALWAQIIRADLEKLLKHRNNIKEVR